MAGKRATKVEAWRTYLSGTVARAKHGPPRLDLRERFWSKVQACEADKCWPWIGVRMHTGYGAFSLGGERGPIELAHRAAWILTHGTVPDGMYVLHRCDNRLCQNPAHLFLGTHLDNIRDMVEKGRNVNPPYPYWQSEKTHCPHGHPYDSNNTRYSPNGKRYCRECNRLNAARIRQARQESPSLR